MLKVSRRVHVKGYRLGEGALWKDRRGTKGDSVGKIEKIVGGVMGKYGYKVGEIKIQKGLVNRFLRFEIGRGGKTMYHMEWLAEILRKGKGEGEVYKMSSRQDRLKGRNAEIKRREIAKSAKRLRVAIRVRKDRNNIKWRWKW